MPPRKKQKKSKAASPPRSTPAASASNTMSVKSPKTLDEVWADASAIVSDALREINKGITRKRYMSVYTAVFDFLCAHSDGEELYYRIKSLLQDYVSEQVERGKPLSDEELLKFFRAQWNDYRLSNRMNNSLFAYLNRTWVKTQKSNNADVFDIAMLADVVWKDHMFLPLHTRLTSAILALIKKDRNGETISTSLLRDTTQCYERLGISKENPQSTQLEVYKEFFEKDFLAETDVYYTVESTNFINENGVSEYMKKVEQRLAEETTRLRAYLHPATEKPLREKLDDVLIKRHMAALHTRAPDFLAEMQQDDLARMYTLLARIGDAGLDPMRSALERHVVDAGRHALAAEADKARESPDVFVAILLRVFRKYQTLIKDAFADDAGFIAAQDKAFREFVNNNDVTNPAPAGGAGAGGAAGAAARRKAAAGSVAKAPQMLAKYVDQILRKGTKHISDEAEMERTLDDVVSLFKYLPDKDVFMLVYSKLLSKRLIHDSSANDDFEAAMINKLKAAQGFEYTSKLTRMVQDIATSKDINASFREWCGQKEHELSLDFSINVLATGIWPLGKAATAFNMPQALVEPVALFKEFYSSKYSGRKLQYMHQLCKAEVQVRYAMKGRLRVNTSTYQLGVLLHFDTANADMVTYGALRDATQLEAKELKLALLSALKTKFIVSDGGAKHKEWTDATKFKLRRDFKSARNRITINVPVSVDGLRTAPSASVEAPEMRRERELKLQAAIVRTMKARKYMTHQAIIPEAISACQKWFKPDIGTIKKCLESLIEQEYLERDEVEDEDGSMRRGYKYKA